MDVEAIRQELREGHSPSLRRRRRVATLAAVGLVDFALISLYQTGVVRHLPDPPVRGFDSDKVNASHKAYAMGLPDGTAGAVLHGVQLMLASVGGSRRSGRHPLWDVLLGGVVLAGVGGALQYLWDMATKQERACGYCLVGAAVSFAMVPPLVPEVREALGALRGGKAGWRA